MALVTCEDCRREVSDKADACPNCGRPMKARLPRGACEVCKKVTLRRRRLGFGTLFAVLVTGGFWLLAIPFYPKRCVVCGSQPPGLFRGGR